MTEIDGQLFSVFWRRYLEKNSGLVSSRDPHILKWLFDQELTCGNDHLIGRFEQEALVGYIVLRKKRMPDGNGVRFFVSDWIALGNDTRILGDLLRDACACVKKQKGAVLEVVGYPDWVQKLIARYLPCRRRIAANTFIYKAGDSFSSDSFCEQANAGWFWGAYDADRSVMC